MLMDAMTLLDAKQYDFARDRRRRNRIITAICLVLVLAWAAYHFRNYSERHAVDKFFGALQKQDLGAAYGIWFHDPDWKQHPAKYSAYPFNDFHTDWGPGGQWGVIKDYSVDCSLSPGSGVIVQATVNGRGEHPNVWVEKSNLTLSFSPNEIQCGNWWAWVLE
jgi:hypothetical protein